jgi:septin family protein
LLQISFYGDQALPAELESLANKAVGADEKTDKELEQQCWKKLNAARADLKRKQEQHAKKVKLLEKAKEAVAAAEEA